MVAEATYAALRAAARRVAEAGSLAAEALADGRVQLEPAFTERMLGSIDHLMNGYVDRGIQWTSFSLTDRVRNSQEKEFGADFAGVLDIDVADYKVKKGFLVQARRIEPFETMVANERRRMVKQCRKMLKHTNDAFVFLYSITGISVVPAAVVVNATFTNPHDLKPTSLQQFYEAHFECIIGDRKISVADVTMPDTLREQLSARRLSYLKAHRSPRQ